MNKKLTILVICLTICLHPTKVFAQVGDISNVNWPGWIPADKVMPEIIEAVSYNAGQQVWFYSFTIRNGLSAEQPIEKVKLRFSSPGANADLIAPSGWWGAFFPPPRSGYPGATFVAQNDLLAGPQRQPSPAQILPGDELSGFSITNSYPPGYARAYIQGYAPVPHILLEEAPTPLIVPHDTTNSQRRWTLAPTRYDAVLTTGDDGLTTDNFLGWMNISDFATILIDPAPIALKFSVVGETVFPETFMATLNGVNVTTDFLPGPSDGADRVGVFRLGSSPLVEGVNVIETSLEGIEGFTGVRGVDIDVMRFRVDPGCSVPQTIVCPS